MSSESTAFDPHLAESLAGAEWRRKVLERLVVMGMTVAEEMEQRAIQGPEPRYCPGKAFAAASRAVRLTLALHAKVEADILAMRNGAAPSPMIAPEAAGAPNLRVEPIWGDAAGHASSTGRVRRLVHNVVREAIDQEIGEEESARGLLRELNERLFEGENYDAFLALPFPDCINAIRADLGMKPNLRRPSGLTACPRPDRTGGRPRHDNRPRRFRNRGRSEAAPVDERRLE